jgi:hypothetical protein
VSPSFLTLKAQIQSLRLSKILLSASHLFPRIRLTTFRTIDNWLRKWLLEMWDRHEYLNPRHGDGRKKRKRLLSTRLSTWNSVGGCGITCSYQSVAATAERVRPSNMIFEVGHRKPLSGFFRTLNRWHGTCSDWSWYNKSQAFPYIHET